MIKAVRVYRTKGQQFERFQDAVDHRENLIDKFLVSLPGYYDMPLRQRTAFMEALLSRRKELIDLLSYDDQPEEDD